VIRPAAVGPSSRFRSHHRLKRLLPSYLEIDPAAVARHATRAADDLLALAATWAHGVAVPPTRRHADRVAGPGHDRPFPRWLLDDLEERGGFIVLKKTIALLLLASFAAIAVHAAGTFVSAGRTYSFFAAAYTVLIFSDVLIVLISLRYNSEFRVAFRYFGFAVATLLVRLALTAPPLFDAALGLGAAVFAWGLTLAYNAFAPVLGADGGGGSGRRPG